MIISQFRFENIKNYIRNIRNACFILNSVVRIQLFYNEAFQKQESIIDKNIRKTTNSLINYESLESIQRGRYIIYSDILYIMIHYM